MKKLLSIIFLISFLGVNSQSGITPLNLWKTTGNAISTNTAFIGTTSNRSLLFKTNNTQVFKIDSLGLLRLFSTSSAQDIDGGFSFSDYNTNATGYKFSYDISPLGSVSQYMTMNTGTLSAGFQTNGIDEFWLGTLTNNDLKFNTNASATPQFVLNKSGYNTSVGKLYLGSTGTAPNARAHFAAGTTAYPAIALTAQSAVSTPTAGNLWYETTRGFLHYGNNTTIGTMSVSSTATIAGNSQLTGSINVGSGTFGSSALNLARFSKGTATLDIGEASAGVPAIWLQQNTPTSSNYVLQQDADATVLALNSPGTFLAFRTNGTTRMRLESSNLFWSNVPFKIGTNGTPTATLEVAGTMSVSSTSTLNTSMTLKAGSIANSGIVIRDDVGANTYGAIYSGVTPSSKNYMIRGISSITDVQGGTTLNLNAGGTTGYIQNASLITMQIPVKGTSSILSSSQTGGIGYATGSGSTVTQGTSRTTGVTINAINGAITLVSAAGQTGWQTFQVTNSTVAATDIIIVNQKSGTDLNMIQVTNVAAGSFKISFATTGGTTTEQPVFNFAVIKAVTN